MKLLTNTSFTLNSTAVEEFKLYECLGLTVFVIWTFEWNYQKESSVQKGKEKQHKGSILIESSCCSKSKPVPTFLEALLISYLNKLYQEQHIESFIKKIPQRSIITWNDIEDSHR